MTFFWKTLSIKSKVWLVSMAGLVGMGVLSFFVADSTLRYGEGTARREFATWAKMSAKAVYGQFTARYLDVQHFAASTIFQSGQRETLIPHLNSYIERFKVYDAIVVVDAGGRFFAANTKAFDGRSLDFKALEGRSFSDSIWFQRAVKGEYFEDTARGLSGSVVEDFQIDPLTSALYGQATPAMSFSRSIVAADGKLLGVLTARASLRLVESQLRESYNALSAFGLTSGDVVALNREGLLLSEISKGMSASQANSAESKVKVLRWNLATQQGQKAAREAISGRAGALFEQDFIGRGERVWGYQRVEESQFPAQLGWSILVSAAKDEVLSEFLWQHRALLFGFALVLVLTALVALGLVQTISYNFREESLKVREESSRLSELLDSLNFSFRKFLGLRGEHGVGSDSSLSIFSRSLLQLNDCSNTLSNLSDRTRRIVVKVNAESARLVASGVQERSSDGGEMSVQELRARLSEIGKSLSQMTDVFLRAQMIGHNATIEATRSEGSIAAFENLADDIGEMTQAAIEICECSRVSVEQALHSTDKIVAEWKSERDGFDASLVRAFDLTKNATNEFSCLSDLFEGMRSSLTERLSEMSSALTSLKTDTVLQAQRVEVASDLENRVSAVQEQAIRIEAMMSDLSRDLMVRIGRARVRKESLASTESAASDSFILFHGQRSRAVVVDRLAQKMRPRLVVGSDSGEPEVSETLQEDFSSRKAG